MNSLTDRLFAIVDLLQGQKQLTTSALAEHFGVSERTIRRDLGRLQDLEIDVETLPGRNGGVRLARGSLLPALRFTDDEALVLALGLKAAQLTADPRLAKAAQSAFKRLEHILSERLSERIDAVLQTLNESTEAFGVEKIEGNLFLDMSEAVQRHERLEIRYRSPTSGFTYRKLDPYGVVHTNEQWYVAGYCHLRQDVRIFRLDRLELLEVTAEHFKPPKDFDPFETVNKSLALAPFPDNITCRIWLDTTLEEASKHVPAYIATFDACDGGVMFTALSRQDWFEDVALYLLDFPFAVQVLEPPELREALLKVAERATQLAKA